MINHRVIRIEYNLRHLLKLLKYVNGGEKFMIFIYFSVKSKLTVKFQPSILYKIGPY